MNHKKCQTDQSWRNCCPGQKICRRNAGLSAAEKRRPFIPGRAIYHLPSFYDARHKKSSGNTGFPRLWVLLDGWDFLCCLIASRIPLSLRRPLNTSKKHLKTAGMVMRFPLGFPWFYAVFEGLRQLEKSWFQLPDKPLYGVRICCATAAYPLHPRAVEYVRVCRDSHSFLLFFCSNNAAIWGRGFAVLLLSVIRRRYCFSHHKKHAIYSCPEFTGNQHPENPSGLPAIIDALRSREL